MIGEGDSVPDVCASGAGRPSEPKLWVIKFVAGDAQAPLFEGALGLIAQSVARFKQEPTPSQARSWRIEAICDYAPVAYEIEGLLADAAGIAMADIPKIAIEQLEDVDWLALNRHQFPPVKTSRFFVHGTQFDGRPPPGATVLCIDAGPAFGSGTHESTRGALMAIDRCAEERGHNRALDLGCGSGILALAFAASTGAAVFASDCDVAAVENTRFNASTNGFSARIEALIADGLSTPVRAFGPFDLVAANILAEPLITMAMDLGEVVEPGGTLILSGLLARQEQDVLASFYEARFLHRFTFVLGIWSTLVMKREI